MLVTLLNWRPLARTAAGLLIAMPLLASAAQDTYQQEVAACNNGQSQQDHATCMREAGAARQETRRNGLQTDKKALGANATDRCANQPAKDRADCEARVSSPSTTSGSVESGGILRQTTTTTTVPAQATP
jgi:hypothetical protein